MLFLGLFLGPSDSEESTLTTSLQDAGRIWIQ